MDSFKVVLFDFKSSKTTVFRFDFDNKTGRWKENGDKENCVCFTANDTCSVEGVLGEGWNVYAARNDLNDKERLTEIRARRPEITQLTVSSKDDVTPTTTATTIPPMQQNPSPTPWAAITRADASDAISEAGAIEVDVNSTVTISCSWLEGFPFRDAQLTLNGLDLNANESRAPVNRGVKHLRHMDYVIPRAGCEHSGPVACRAPNAKENATRILRVQCPPSGSYDVGTVSIISGPVSLTFDVTAYPTPERLTFFYLGTSVTDTHPMEISDSQIQLTGVCHPKAGAVYQSTCTVTVTNINMDKVSSFFQVTVTNRHGSGHFRFHVLCKGCGGSSGAESDAPSYLGFAVGVSVVLAVSIIIIIVVIILMWRWRWPLPCDDTSNRTGPSNPTGGSDAVFTRNTTGSGIRSTSSAYDYPQPVQHPAEQTGLYACVNLVDVGQRAVYTRLRSHDTPHATGPRLPWMRSSDPSDYLHPIAGLAERADTAHATGPRLQSMRLSDPSDYLHPIAGLVERADTAHATGPCLQSVTSHASETYLHPIPGPADQAGKPNQARGKATGATPSGLWKSGRSHVHGQLMEELHKEMKAQPE